MGTDRKALYIFLLITFGICWATAGAMYLFDVKYGDTLSLVLIAGPCMTSPAIAALLVRWRVKRYAWHELGIIWKGVNWKWMSITALVGMLFIPLTLFFIWIFSNVLGLEGFGTISLSADMVIERIRELAQDMDPDNAAVEKQIDMIRDRNIPGWVILLITLLSGLLGAVSFNLPFMLGEELGWRGLMQHELSRAGFWRMILTTGPVWGIWHAPIILMGHNYPDHPLAGVFLMCVFSTLLAIPFAHLRFRTNCIWGPCLLHGLINGTANGYVLFAAGSTALLASPVGIAGFCAIAVLATGLLLLDPDVAKTFNEQRSTLRSSS